jgi:hypothetical protein
MEAAPPDPELIAGVNIIDVASKEEAIAWMKRCPTLQGPSIEAEFEIRPIIEMSPTKGINSSS